MLPAPVRTELPLDEQDRKKIQLNFIGIGVFLLLAGGVFALIFSQFFKDGFGDSGMLYFFIGFAALFFGIVVYAIVQHVRELSEGVKIRLEGYVTDKQQHTSRSSSGTGRRRRARTKTTYYLHFGEERLEVNVAEFNSVNTGDKVEVFFMPRSKNLLGITTLERNRAASQQPAQAPSPDQTAALPAKPKLDVKPKEKRLEADDLAELRRHWRGGWGWRIFLGIFLSVWFFLAFTFVIELFSLHPAFLAAPPVAAFVLAFRPMAVRYRKVSQDEVYGYKVPVVLHIEDKRSQTGSRSNGQTLYTDKGEFEVSGRVYDAVMGGQTVVMYFGKYSNHPVSVETVG